jgi:hypothetical protein
MALNVRVPLSRKRKALGDGNRVDALMPFAECIRKHLQNVICVAVDVEAFKRTPGHLRKLWTDNPHFIAFTRVLLEVIKPVQPHDCINIICDDEEETALPMYNLYRRVKLVYTDTRARLASLSFADDRLFVPLQGADMVASLARMEARRIFANEDYAFGKLWEAIGKPLASDKLWGFNTCFCGADQLVRLGEAEFKAQQFAKKHHCDRKLLSAD